MNQKNINTLLLAVIAGALTVQAVPIAGKAVAPHWETFQKNRAERHRVSEAKRFCTAEYVDQENRRAAEEHKLVHEKYDKAFKRFFDNASPGDTFPAAPDPDPKPLLTVQSCIDRYEVNRE